MEETQKSKQKLGPRKIEVVDDVMAEILRQKTTAERI
jgi:hypothetical protein